MECGFFSLSGEEELILFLYILFLGASGREDLASQILPLGGEGWRQTLICLMGSEACLSTESPAVLKRPARNRKPQHPRESHKDNAA